MSIYEKYKISLPSILNGQSYLDENGINYCVDENKLSCNGQFLSNGSLIINSNEKKYGGNITFNKIEMLDENKEVIKTYPVKEYMVHECIVGSNIPRYYTPSFDYSTANNNVLMITCSKKENSNISKDFLADNSIVEIDENGIELWRFDCSKHLDEFELSNYQKNKIERDNYFMGYGRNMRECCDWIHLNSACTIGENKWYDQGHEEFNPENIIVCARSIDMVFIISKKEKKIVWKLNGHEAGLFNKQHYAHIIPKGLPGEGNLLLFDHGSDNNGSGILEINPITKEVVFEYYNGLFSGSQSSVQKMKNGTYLIGYSNAQRILVVNENKKVELDEEIPFVFYRAIAYPKEWMKF